jgi:hypothetical protein
MITENFDNNNTIPDNQSIFSYLPISILDKLGYTEYGNIPNPPDAIDEFRKRKCEHNQLKHKGMNVRNNNIEFIYPEVKFKTNACNPCDPTCGFSIIETKLRTETGLIPTDSNNLPL